MHELQRYIYVHIEACEARALLFLGFVVLIAFFCDLILGTCVYISCTGTVRRFPALRPTSAPATSLFYLCVPSVVVVKNASHKTQQFYVRWFHFVQRQHNARLSQETTPIQKKCEIC